MPLTKLENLYPDGAWGLWEISESLEELRLLLRPETELDKFSLISNQEKVKEKIAARLVIKHILESWKESFSGTLCDPSGKPLLINLPYTVSLSHSHGMAVAIVKKNGNIGIDIELIKDKIVKIGPRVFVPEEMEEEENNREKLTLLWTMKEVLYKLNGQKGVDFKENLFIPPFKYHSEGGNAEGIIRTNTQNESFEIRYLKHQDYIISFNI